MEISTVTTAKDNKLQSVSKETESNESDYIQSLHSSNVLHHHFHHHQSNKEFCKKNPSSSATADVFGVLGVTNNDDDDLYYDSTDSLETCSDEIPIWVHGEQRWISGVNDETTCSDLVNVLLADEGITSASTTINNSVNKGFVITERWRRVEQILNDDTKILQIWSAWGHAKSEMKLTLRQMDPNLKLDSTEENSTFLHGMTNNDKDSGMGSPIGSSNSAIIRRRKHRASKLSYAWMTQAQTYHPKSQKATIEKLMKLILEQGETIQHQLSKLRDREYQITKIEEDRHKTREKEHGKNYLLETYLKGLHEIEDKEIVTGTSDSGVQTEGALSSPEIGINEDDEYVTKCIQGKSVIKENLNDTIKSKFNTIPYKQKISRREKILLKEHKQTKEYSSMLQRNSYKFNQIINSKKSDIFSTNKTNNIILSSTPKRSSTKDDIKHPKSIDEIHHHQSSSKNIKNDDCNRNDFQLKIDQPSDQETDINEKIIWMEKIIEINKHLQREEELLVRLNTKIRKLETEDPQLTESQVREQIKILNENIVKGNSEIEKIENDIITSKEKLDEKNQILDKLSNELMNSSTTENSSSSSDVDEELTLNEVKLPEPEKQQDAQDEDKKISELILNENLQRSEIAVKNAIENSLENEKIHLNAESSVFENLYSYSRYIAKPIYDFNTKNENIKEIKLPNIPNSITDQNVILHKTEANSNMLLMNRMNNINENENNDFIQEIACSNYLNDSVASINASNITVIESREANTNSAQYRIPQQQQHQQQRKTVKFCIENSQNSSDLNKISSINPELPHSLKLNQPSTSINPLAKPKQTINQQQKLFNNTEDLRRHQSLYQIYSLSSNNNTNNLIEQPISNYQHLIQRNKNLSLIQTTNETQINSESQNNHQDQSSIQQYQLSPTETISQYRRRRELFSNTPEWKQNSVTFKTTPDKCLNLDGEKFQDKLPVIYGKEENTISSLNNPNIINFQTTSTIINNSVSTFNGQNCGLMNIYATPTNRINPIRTYKKDFIPTTGISSNCAFVNKLSPKRLINKIGNNDPESNSDTGLSLMGENGVHMGTLV